MNELGIDLFKQLSLIFMAWAVFLIAWAGVRGRS